MVSIQVLSSELEHGVYNLVVTIWCGTGCVLAKERTTTVLQVGCKKLLKSF